MEIDNGTRQPKTVREVIALYLTGMGMGAADTVPGVSGGTIAFVRGIYGDLLNAIKSFNLDLLKLIMRLDFKGVMNYVPWKFLLTLGLGILTAVFTLVRFVTWAMEHERVYLFAFFFGLVLASAVAVGSKIQRWRLSHLLLLVTGAVLAFTIVGLVPHEGAHEPINIFLSGCTAVMAMILPGISGSSILLVLGQYEYVLNAVKSLDMGTLILLASGCVVGLAVFSRILSWLLNRYNQLTLALLIGFVLGSLRAVWPWQVENTVVVEGIEEIVRTSVAPDVGSPEFFLALLFAAFGFIVVSVVDHLEARTNPVMRLIWRNNRSSLTTS